MINTAKTMYQQGYEIKTIFAITKITKDELYSNLTSMDKKYRNESDLYKNCLSDDLIGNIRNDFRQGEDINEMSAKYSVDKGVIRRIFTDEDKRIRRNALNRFRPDDKNLASTEIDFFDYYTNTQLQDGRLEWVSDICNKWLKEKQRSA